MKFLRIFFTVILAIVLVTSASAYPYVSSFNEMINDKKELTEIVVESEINKDIKVIIDKEIENYLNELEKEVVKTVKESLKKSTKGKINVNSLMKSKEVKNSIKKIKDEVSDILGKFNTEDNINVILAKAINVLHDDEEIDVNGLIKEIINEIIKKDNIKLESETKELLDDFALELSESLYEEIKSSEDSFIILNEENNRILNPLPSYIKLFNKYTNHLLIEIIVLVIIILLINIKSLYSGIRAIGIATLISGILVVLTSSIFKLIDAEVSSEYSVGTLALKLLQTLIAKVSMMGVIYIIVGIIAIIISIVLAKIKKKTELAK